MSGKTDMGGPAFPAPDFAVSKEIADEKLVMRLKNLQGMTLWDYYAAHTPTERIQRALEYGGKISEACASHADAMLAERAKRTEGQS